MPLCRPYIGRFAPSPTGPLHAGSIVTALASWLDARAHGGRWLLRIEDLDPPREVPGAAGQIIDCLQRLGLHWDDEICFQSQRGAHYAAALEELQTCGQAYACTCSRADILRHWARLGIQAPSGGREWPYPGTCRNGAQSGARTDRSDRSDYRPCSWRLRVPAGIESFVDRRCGPQHEDVLNHAGDFVLRRADGLWAYQLAVVVDDAAQGVTDIVRGEDLLDSTPRQRVLQRALGRPHPRTMHLALVLGSDGHKLSKQNGAMPVDPSDPLAVLNQALQALELPRPVATHRQDWLAQATASWAARWSMIKP